MKKALSLVLAIAMMATLATTAFAAAPASSASLPTIDDKPVSVEVAVNYTNDETKVYSVEVVWGDPIFKYTFEAGKGWNPQSHAYDVVKAEGATGAWNKTDASVTITNHSNCNITATAKLVDGTAIDGVTVDLDKTSATINTIAGTEETTPKFDAFKVSVSGTPTTMATVAATTVKTVQITLADAAVA